MNAKLTSSNPQCTLDAVWRASELGEIAQTTVPSGHAGLDAELPGAGWPRGNLSELLQSQAGLHEWRLLLPALRACLSAAPQQALVFIGNPHLLNLAALAHQGIAQRSVVMVEAEKSIDRLWAAEQALRCRDVATVLLWAPQVRPEQLRRLQVAAQTNFQTSLSPLVFVCRPWAAQHESSPAPLRLSIQMASKAQLSVQVLKRRGPVHANPLLLPPSSLPAITWRDMPARIAHSQEIARDPVFNPSPHFPPGLLPDLLSDLPPDISATSFLVHAPAYAVDCTVPAHPPIAA